VIVGQKEGFNLRLLSICLAVTIMLGSFMVLFTVNVTADYQSGDFYYKIINGGSQIEISGYHGSASELAIPNMIDNKPVTSIGLLAFSGRSSLKVVGIPDNIVSIGNYAFSDCEHLVEVNIGRNVTSIGVCAFFKCTSLVNVSSPSKLFSIGELAFAYCTSLTSAPIPDNVKSIEESAFAYCRSLHSVVIPNGVTSIANYTFLMCSSLTSVEISENVTSIHSLAFDNCTLLTRMEFKGNAPQCDSDWITNHNTNLTIYYTEGATGFTSPTWLGIPTEEVSANGSRPSVIVDYGPHWLMIILGMVLVAGVIATLIIVSRKKKS